MDMIRRSRSKNFLILLSFVGIICPLFIKRAIFVGEYSYHDWLIADYIARLVIILSAFCTFRFDITRSDKTGISANGAAPIFVLALIAAAMQQVYISPALYRTFAGNVLAHPSLDIGQPLAVFDLFLGLALVALSEELAFRKYLFELFEQLGIGPWGVVLLSSAIFALLHFTDGYPNTINTFIDGCFMGILFFVTRRLTLCVIAHYLIDFYVVGSWYGGAGLFEHHPV
jgi:membrane protease YdiL (CAAX protease family)